MAVTLVPETTPPAPRPALVGREREQAALREALDAALAGRGALVLIGGEAGIGKTALAEALLAEAAEPGRAGAGGALLRPERDPALRPLGRGARPRARATTACPPPPDLRRRAAGAASQAALFAPGARLPRRPGRRAGPLVLLLDDLHWADPASLDLLRVVGRAASPTCRSCSLATYRADEVDRRPPARRPPARSWCARPAPPGSTCARWTGPPSARSSRRATPWPRPRPRAAGRLPGRAHRGQRALPGRAAAHPGGRGRCCAGRARGWVARRPRRRCPCPRCCGR